jgi:diguanylate cyclase (GGDEF)-like protein
MGAQFPKRLARAAALAAGAASLWGILQSDLAQAAINALTVALVAGLLVFGPRRTDPLKSTRWLLLGALGVTCAASVMALGYEAVTGHQPPRPWVGDWVALLYAPLTIGALLVVPPGPRSTGYRARALADAFLALTSLWYLVAALGRHHFGLSFSGQLGHATAFAYAAGDVCVIATALTVLSRCAPTVTRTVGGIAAGVAAAAANDIWLLVSRSSPYAAGPALLFQMALLLFVTAAALPAPRPRPRPRATLIALGTAPFVPLFACMFETLDLVLRGRGIPPLQVLPALMVAIALTVRAYVSSNEKQRLLDRLREREAGLEAALRRDPLTGLANRLGLMERLDAVLEDPRRSPAAVALVDLNDFKLINDSRGHAVGDDLLRQTAHRLGAAVRSDDLVARLGGDEFAVVATGMSPAQRDGFAARLLHAFGEPIDAGGQHLTVSASIGVVFAASATTAAELLAQADAAMYRGKDGARAGTTVTVLDEDGRTDITRHLQIRDAVADPRLEQFHVHYQPVVELDSGTVRGFEALLRWTHPELGTIAPDAFVPLAEQAGSIVELGWHVLLTATRDLARLQQAYPDHPLLIAVNVSPHQLTQENFTEQALARLAQHGVAPHQLVLEVTERAFATHLSQAAETLAGLASAGVRIAVDDFGTGYSNLRYLQRLHPTSVKLDRSFVGELPGCESTRRLIAAVAVMTATLGLPLVAEGIETEAQLATLRAMGCPLGQGYLFSPPVPLEEAERLLSTGWAVSDSMIAAARSISSSAATTASLT